MAETCVFGKQSLEPIFCGPLTHDEIASSTLPGHPFSRSYGVNLPSSLTEDRSSTLGRLPLPTSVGVRYGLQRSDQSLRGFSRRPGHDAATIPSSETPDQFCRMLEPDLPGSAAPPADPPCPFGVACAPYRVPPSLSDRRCRNIDLLSIAYAGYQPPLRPRLTLGRLPWPRNPQAFGVKGSHLQ